MSQQFQQMMAMMEQKFQEKFEADVHKIQNQLHAQSQEVQQNNPESITKIHYTQELLENPPKSQQIIKQTHEQVESHDQIPIASENVEIARNLFAENNQKQIVENEEIDQIDDQEDQDYYKSLSEKLEKALHKISSDKKLQKPTSKIHNFYDRLNDFEKKKKHQLEEKLKEKEAQINSQLKPKPMISSQSQKIIQHQQPIYLRSAKLIDDRKKKIQEQIQRKKRKEEEEQLKIQEEYKKYMEKISNKVGQVRSPEDYYKDMKQWNKKREQNIAQKKEKEIQQQRIIAPFKPKISEKSQIMMKKNSTRVPIYQRQILPKTSFKDENCTFKPKINKIKK